MFSSLPKNPFILNLCFSRLMNLLLEICSSILVFPNLQISIESFAHSPHTPPGFF